jgi:tetratricopeptide (TPR) repeat protein
MTPRPILPVGAIVLLASCAHQSQTAAVKTPPAPSAMQRQVLNAVDAGDGDIELKTLRARIIAEPANLNARLELGKAYEQRGYPELAIDHYRWATEHSPESAEAQLVLARALDFAGYLDQGIASLSAFLKDHPQDGPTLYSWLGIMRDDASDWKGSEQAYREAMSKSKEDRDYLHNNLGYALLKQGENEKAAAEFRAALKLNPHSEIARGNLGLALAPASPKEAIVNWQSMNDPASAHSNMAAVLIEQGKYSEARKELEVALQYNRKNSAALANLELLSGLDGKPAALPLFTKPATRWARLKSSVRHWFGVDRSTGQESLTTASKTNTSESKP